MGNNELFFSDKRCRLFTFSKRKRVASNSLLRQLRASNFTNGSSENGNSILDDVLLKCVEFNIQNCIVTNRLGFGDTNIVGLCICHCLKKIDFLRVLLGAFHTALNIRLDLISPHLLFLMTNRLVMSW